MAFVVVADGRNNGNITGIQTVGYDFGIHFGNFSDVAEFRIRRFAFEHMPVDAAKSDGFAADALDEVDERFIDLARQHHPHDLHGFFVGIAQSVDKYRFLAHLFEHFGNFGPAPVHQHDFDADQVQKHDVAHDGIFQFVVDHGVAAVLHDDDFMGIVLNIWEGFRKNVRPKLFVVAIVIHFFLFYVR